MVFDKTGTLTEPTLALADDPARDPEALALAASLAAEQPPSAGPRAAGRRRATSPAAAGVEERRARASLCGAIRLGSTPSHARSRLGASGFAGRPCGPRSGEGSFPPGPELWLARPGHAPVCFTFHERLRPDAAATVATSAAPACAIMLASGDRAGPVAPIAAALGIADWRAGTRPDRQGRRWWRRCAPKGHHVLMVGDGLNDGPSLAAASVSASPATAADISQTAPTSSTRAGAARAGRHRAARGARARRRSCGRTCALSLCYNVVMLPLAMAGQVTPWLAAVAMSASSLAGDGQQLPRRTERKDERA